MAAFPSARVVLVEPKYAGNVGSVCRALKNFGFERLVLVRPRAATGGAAAREMAYGAHDVLRDARTVATLEEAVEGASRAIGTAGRSGRYAGDYLAPEEMARLLRRFEPASESVSAAFVFGPEDRGLRASEINRCDWVVRIPTEPARASINLSHAVAITAYALRNAYLFPELEEPPPAASMRDALLRHAERLLRDAGFLRSSDPRRLSLKLSRLLARTTLTRRDVATLHAILDHLEERLRRRN